jgi:hypothetical protein
MSHRRISPFAALLLGLAGFLAAVPASAQVLKATVKINGMI